MSVAAAAASSSFSFAVGARRLHFPARSKMPLSFSPAATFSPLSCSSLSSPSSAAGPAVDHEEGTRPKPWLLVGLGNPGKMYERTRHNVGFEMVDSIAQAEGISINNVHFKALFGKGHIGNVPVMLAKPQTFMNASGI